MVSVPAPGEKKIGDDGRLYVYVPIEVVAADDVVSHRALVGLRRTWRRFAEAQSDPDGPVVFHREERFG